MDQKSRIDGTAGKIDPGKLREIARDMIRAGNSDAAIKSKLEEMGIGEVEALETIGLARAGIATGGEERSLMGRLLPGIAGGVLAAIVGGIAWGLIVVATDYEIGFMALGIGFLCGFGVLLFSGGRKGLPYQLIAAFASVIGILIGKYYIFWHYLKKSAVENFGAEAARDFPLFSWRVIRLFGESLGEMLTGHDALWVLFAVITAWGIPSLTRSVKADPGKAS